MIYEIAQIDVIEGQENDFVAAVAQAAPHFQSAKGCHSFKLARSIELPSRFRLIVGWETVDDHMVEFRGSPGFAAWRTLASPFFASPPSVEHVEYVVESF
jgi:quinol monooxygenase YgiN